MLLSADHLASLTRIVGPRHVRTGTDLAALDPGVDPHNYRADALLLPASTDEVAALLAYCNAHAIAVVPQGGRTGLSGGASTAPGQVALSLARLDRIDSVDALSRTAVVGAGVTLGALSARAAEDGLSPGIDLGARDSATIGGMVSTNAGGVAAFRHGTMRERVLGLEAVLADGRVLRELGQVRKRNEGLAVERLLIGAEGTLGIITRVALALVPADGPVATALVALDGLEAAARLCDRAQAAPGAVPTAIEVMSGNHAAAVCRALSLADFAPLAAAPFLVLLELSAASADAAESALVDLLGASVEEGLVRDAIVAQNEAQRHTMWRIREDWAIDRERPGGLWYDVSVPLAALPAYVAALSGRLAHHDGSLDLVVIGHLADGNLHVTVNAPTPLTPRYEEIAPLVTDGLAEVGGSFSAEHGIGLEKKATLARLAGAPKQALMRGLKALYDPRGILNPGKVIPGG
jgi:FAD/FMN-containing dehydrogenase